MILRALDHPSLIKMEELHESKNSIYLVMELLEGGELLFRIGSKNMMKPEDSK